MIAHMIMSIKQKITLGFALKLGQLTQYLPVTSHPFLLPGRYASTEGQAFREGGP